MLPDLSTDEVIAITTGWDGDEDAVVDSVVARLDGGGGLMAVVEAATTDDHEVVGLAVVLSFVMAALGKGINGRLVLLLL